MLELTRHDAREVATRSPVIEASGTARTLYDRAKEDLKSGAVIVLGPNADEVAKVLAQLERRLIPQFDPRSYLATLSRFERCYRCPMRCFEEGKTPSQEFFDLLFTYPDDPFSVKIKSGIFLLGWEDNPLLVWSRKRLVQLSLVVIDETEGGIAFGNIPKHAV